MDKLAVVLPSRGLTPKQEYMRCWRANNKARLKASRRAYYLANREKALAYAKEWTKNHRELDRAKSRAYRANPSNRENRLAYSKKYYQEKEKTNATWLIKSRLRARLRRAITSSAKPGSAVADLGCTVQELVVYLETQFKDGMSWDNWGKWHIDHKIPLSHFDLTDKGQFNQACHFTNLQPLWAEENMAKGNRWTN